MSLLISLQSETLKNRRSAAFYLTIVAAALLPFIFLLDALIEGVSPNDQKDAFNHLFKEGFGMVYLALLPLFVIVMCTLLAQLEYRNNTWKQVFASPQPMANLYVAKFLHTQSLILLFLIAFNAFLLAVAVATHYLIPKLNLLNQPLNVSQVLAYNVNAYIAVLAITALQFWLGLRFKNFMVPMAIGLAMWLIATMMLLEYHSAISIYIPYAYTAYSYLPKYKPQLATVQWASAGYAVLFLLLGFVDFRRRKA